MTPPLVQQLRSAWEASGMTLPELVAAAGLECSADSLSRKLSGKQVMTTEECQAIASALGVTLAWVPDKSAASVKVEGAA